jgi:hypothetical protein
MRRRKEQVNTEKKRLRCTQENTSNFIGFKDKKEPGDFFLCL